MKHLNYQRETLKLFPNAEAFWGNVGWGVRAGSEILCIAHYSIQDSAWRCAYRVAQTLTRRAA